MSKNRAVLNVIGFIGAERCIGYSACVSSYATIRYSFNNYDFGDMICANCNQPLKPLNSTMIGTWHNSNTIPVETMIASRLCDACHARRMTNIRPEWHICMSEHFNIICDIMALTHAQRNDFSIQHLLYLCEQVAKNDHKANIFVNARVSAIMYNILRYVRLNTTNVLFNSIRLRTGALSIEIREQINRSCAQVIPHPVRRRMRDQRVILAPNDHDESTLVRNDALRINDRADSVIIPINEPRIIKTNNEQSHRSSYLINIFDTILSPAVMNFIRSTFCLPCIIP